MTSLSDSDAEELLARALAEWDQGGEAALAHFVEQHAAHATVLQRGIKRCRDMGLLGRPQPSDAFPERLDDFRLVRRIGGGGMGVVYEAEQQQLGRRVALKVIRPELLYFEGARERFRREVDAIAKLSHPAIVPVLASGEHEGVPYFAMELLTGRTAEEVCIALRGRDPASLGGADLRAVVHGPADDTGVFAGAWWQACTQLAQQVALGMRHAHLRGIVHRDLKPSNVMITPHGQAIVLDFGVAQTNAGRALTRAGETPGSPAFMSPEQLRGEATDERTDVYSLAATLWQLLTLERPFPEAKVHEHVQLGLLPALRAKNRAAPRELELVLRTAMDRDRNRRYGDMAAFGADLAAVLQRKPITARPLGLGLRLLRWSQRHKVAATAAVAALISTATLPTALMLQQRTANRRLIAEQQRTQQSLETSLDALHAVLVRLGNDQLRHVPLAEQISHAALLDAAELFRKLLAQHPDHVRVRVQAGRALHALAMSFARQGQPTESRAIVREAIDVLGGDALDCVPAMLDIRAHARMSLAGDHADHGERAQARAAVEAAERDFMAAARWPQYATEALRGRANLHITRSLLYDEAREAARVEAELRAAVERIDEAVAAGPADPKDPGLQLTYVANLAKFMDRQRRDEEARALFERARQLAAVLQPSERAWPPPAAMRADVDEGYGNLLSRLGDPAAERHLRSALEARGELVAQFPSNLMFRIMLSGAQHNLGVWIQRQGNRTAEALQWFEQAYAGQKAVLAANPEHAQARAFLVNHLRMLGTCRVQQRDGAGTAAVAAELAEVAPADKFYALFLAKLHLAAHRLLAARATAEQPAPDYRPAALAQLNLAIERGAKAADLAESAFKPLHDCPEWAELVARAGAAQPAANGK